MRKYAPAFGRWMNVDPLAEYMWSYSPYSFAFNNPVYYIDPDGQMPFSPGGEDLEVSELLKDSGGGDGLSGSGGKDPDPQYPNTSGVQKLDEVNLGVVKKKEHPLMGNENSGRGNIFTWGNGIEENGSQGKANGELNINDLPIPMAGKTGNPLMDFLKDLLELFDWNDRAQKALKSNESTMENKIENEKKNAPETVKITIQKVTLTRGHKDKVINYSIRDKDTTVNVKDHPSEIYKKASRKADSLLNLARE